MIIEESDNDHDCEWWHNQQDVEPNDIVDRLVEAKECNENSLEQHYNEFLEEIKVGKSSRKQVDESLEKASVEQVQTLEDETKNMINLENIMLLEKKLCSILDAVESMDEVIPFCEDWWDLSQEETMLQNLGNVFKEPKYK